MPPDFEALQSVTTMEDFRAAAGYLADALPDGSTLRGIEDQPCGRTFHFRTQDGASFNIFTTPYRGTDNDAEDDQERTVRSSMGQLVERYCDDTTRRTGAPRGQMVPASWLAVAVVIGGVFGAFLQIAMEQLQ